MKHLLRALFGMLLLPAFTVSAQDHYLFPPGTTIYDLPGDHFLTHRIANSKVYVEDRDGTGTVVWSDSLTQAIYPQAFQIGRFGDTDNYRFFIQDSVVAWHATFSMDTHQFGDFRADTLSSWYRRTSCPLTDTSMYLFTGDYNATGVIGHTVRTITESGATTLLPLTFESSPATGFKFLRHDGGILELYNNYGWMHSRRFDMNLQQTSPAYSDSLSSGYDFPEIIYSRMKNEDSIFAFCYNYDFTGTDRHAWVMAWLTPEMDTLSVFEHNFDPNVYPNYPLGFDDVVLTDDYIFVYAYKYFGSGIPLPRQLVVFDYQFDTVCSYLTDDVGEAHLLLLNEQAYTIWDNPGNVELFRVEPCGFADLDESGRPEVTIYPNPSDGDVRIEFQPGTVHTIEVWDLNGQLLLQQQVEQLSGSLTLPLGSLENGIYLVKAIGGNEYATARIVLND